MDVDVAQYNREVSHDFAQFYNSMSAKYPDQKEQILKETMKTFQNLVRVVDSAVDIILHKKSKLVIIESYGIVIIDSNGIRVNPFPNPNPFPVCGTR